MNILLPCIALLKTLKYTALEAVKSISIVITARNRTMLILFVLGCLWHPANAGELMNIKLNTQLPAGVDVGNVVISPDSQTVVYQGDSALYSVPIDGSTTAVRLTLESQVVAANVELEISPDSTMVVFVAEDLEDGLYHLLRVPIDGAVVPETIATSSSTSALTADHRFSVFEDTLVYSWRAQSSDQAHLYSAAGNGAASPINLTEKSGAFGSYQLLGFTPGGETMSYLGDRPGRVNARLMSVRLDGGADPLCVSCMEPPLSYVSTFLEPSPDGLRVFFSTHAPFGIGGVRVTHYSARIDGIGDPIQLSGTRLIDTNNSVYRKPVSADGEWFVYVGQEEGSTSRKIFSRRANGLGPLIELNPPLPMNMDVGILAGITPDAKRVLFSVDANFDDYYELVARNIDGSGDITHIAPSLFGEFGFVLFVQSATVCTTVMFASEEPGGVINLYAVGTGNSTQINMIASSADLGGAIPAHFDLHRNERQILYVFDDDNDGLNHLFLVPLDGGFPPREVGGPFLEFAATWQDSLNGDWIVQRVREEPDGDLQLYSFYIGDLRAEGESYEAELAIPHSADQNADNRLGLSELLRIIQFYNSASFGCNPGTEDGYEPDNPDQSCIPHDGDYNEQDWTISLSELLRMIQAFNSEHFHYCPNVVPPTEDGFCATNLVPC